MPVETRPHRIVLLSVLPAEVLSVLAYDHLVRDLSELEAVDPAGAVLVAFGTGVIVAPALLERFAGRAYNLHAASPTFPGRDPHHWAVYEGADQYGATFHQMTSSVDSGPIIAADLFDTPGDASPSCLLDQANAVGLALLQRMLPSLRRGETPAPDPTLRWGPVKRSRRDFLAMCRIDPDMDAAEFERRYRAFDGGNYDNLYVELHGRRFRIDKRL